MCHTGPPPLSADCQQFFNVTRLKYPEEYEELQVVDKGGKSFFCFNAASPKPSSRGWCETAISFYEFKAVEKKGWGFCSRDCYLGEYNRQESSNILREVRGVDVLPHALCDLYLNVSAKGRVRNSLFHSKSLSLRVTMSDLLSSQERPWDERESLFNKKLRD